MDTTFYTLKTVIKLMEQWAGNHVQINRYTFGTIQEADLGKSNQYPWMHVSPNGISYDMGTRTLTIDVMLADLVKDKDDKANSQLDVINNCHMIMEDLINTLENSDTFGDDVILIKPISVTPFYNDFSNNLSGVEASISFEYDYQFNYCETQDVINNG